MSLYFNWSCDFQRFTKSKKLSKFQVRTTTFVLLNKSLSTSLFNLQGTRRLSQTALLDYHNSFRLSRTFFKFFQTFSSQSSLFHRFRPPPSRTALLDYHILKPLSRTFFLNSKLFSWLSSVPPSLAGKLAYNIKPFPLCQAFFAFF